YLRPDDAPDRLVAGVGAAVVGRGCPEAEDCPVGLDRDLSFVEPTLVAAGVGRVMLGAPLGPLDKTVELAGEQAANQKVGVPDDFVAEASADVLRDEADLVGARTQRRSHEDEREPRELVVAVERPFAAPAVVRDERSAALDRRRREPVEVE